MGKAYTSTFFTKIFVALLREIRMVGENPIIGEVYRSKEEQWRRYKIGRYQDENGVWRIANKKLIQTYCDGRVKFSKHNFKKAGHIYFEIDGKLDFSKKKYLKWHKRWTELGGRPPFRDKKTGKHWDLCHFEI